MEHKRKHELELFLSTQNIHIILMAETHFTEKIT
jgi:hypothetical protein